MALDQAKKAIGLMIIWPYSKKIVSTVSRPSTQPMTVCGCLTTVVVTIMVKKMV